MRGAGLIEVYHLVVLDGVEALVERLGVFFCMGNDGAEEGQTVVALANPEGEGDGSHVGHATGASGAEHEWDDEQGIRHIARQTGLRR